MRQACFINQQHKRQCIPNQHISKQNCAVDSVQKLPANPSKKKSKGILELKNEISQCFNLCNPQYQWSTQVMFSDSLLLTVGNLLCLVILWQKSARRDKVCPQYRVRNWTCTNDLQTPKEKYGPLGNACSTCPFKNNKIWTVRFSTMDHTILTLGFYWRGPTPT